MLIPPWAQDYPENLNHSLLEEQLECACHSYPNANQLDKIYSSPHSQQPNLEVNPRSWVSDQQYGKTTTMRLLLNLINQQVAVRPFFS